MGLPVCSLWACPFHALQDGLSAPYPAIPHPASLQRAGLRGHTAERKSWGKKGLVAEAEEGEE